MDFDLRRVYLWSVCIGQIVSVIKHAVFRFTVCLMPCFFFAHLRWAVINDNVV